MTETRVSASFHVSRDLLQHYTRKYEDKMKVKVGLQDELEFKQGELANEKRMRQWLETRLDTVVHALANKEGTQRYKDEYKADDLVRSVLVHTQNDLLNEKRLREKLEETVAVIERAKDIEEIKRKYEDDSQIIVLLQNNLEITETDLIKEKEMVRVLEETIADLEKPIVEELDRDVDEEEEQKRNVEQLENAQREYLAERKTRQRLQRKLAELEAAMPNYQVETMDNVIRTAENSETLEQMQGDLLVERSLRQKLFKKLKSIQDDENSSQSDKRKECKEDENMLQSLLKCTLDKLSNERQVRRVLEEKLEVLEHKVMKEQARTQLEGIRLELTQNELSQEREVRLSLEQQLASLEAARSEGFVALPQEDNSSFVDNFEERLDALDNIIMSIKAQNKHVEEQLANEKHLNNEESMQKLQQQPSDATNDIISLQIHDCLSTASSAASSITSSECNDMKYCMEMMHEETLGETDIEQTLTDESEIITQSVACLEDTPHRWQMIEHIVNATLEPDGSTMYYSPQEIKEMPLEWTTENSNTLQINNELVDDIQIGLNASEKDLNQSKFSLHANNEYKVHQEELGVLEQTFDNNLILNEKEAEGINEEDDLWEPPNYPLQHDTAMIMSQEEETRSYVTLLEEKVTATSVNYRRNQTAEQTQAEQTQDTVGTTSNEKKLYRQDNGLEDKLTEMGAIKRRTQEPVECCPLQENSQRNASHDNEDKSWQQDNTLEKLAQLGAIIKNKHKESKIRNRMVNKEKLPSVFE